MGDGVNEARVFRVTVRGRFTELSEAARAYLRAHRAEHDLFVSSFRAEGSLSYDDRLDFFNLRYEVRLLEEPTAEHAGVVALTEAEHFLATMRFGSTALRADVMDLSTMTSRRPRR